MPVAESKSLFVSGNSKRFSAGRRYYVGYDESVVSGIEEYLPQQVENAPSPVTTMRDVTLVAPAVPEDRKSMAGGVYRDGTYLPEFALMRADRPFSLPGAGVPEGSSETLEEAWFGGYLLNPFGHFIVESISRLLDERVILSELPIAFLVPFRVNKRKRLFRAARFMTEIFGLLRIDPKRLRFCITAMEIRRMHSVAPYLVARGKLNVAALPILKSCYGEPKQGADRIYLSRSRVRSKRGIAGENKIEDMLAGYGFSIVHPQEHSVAEQIGMLNAAHTIVGIEGSALHTLMFAHGRKNVVVLSHDKPTATYTMLDESFDGDTYYFRNELNENQVASRNEWTISQKLIDRLEDMIVDIGGAAR
jgi:hypothetical protein